MIFALRRQSVSHVNYVLLRDILKIRKLASFLCLLLPFANFFLLIGNTHVQEMVRNWSLCYAVKRFKIG